MKFYTFSLAFLFCIVLAPISNGHEFFLNNGRTVKTKAYWKEDNVVCYEKFGAIIKIPKSNINKIEHTTMVKTKDVLNNELSIADSTEELKFSKSNVKLSVKMN